MAGNTTLKKQYSGNSREEPQAALPPKMASMGVRPGRYTGEMSNLSSEAFASPMNMGAPAKISGIGKTYNDIGEVSGFITDGYLDKGNTPYGENAKFNYLPPGMDISNQMNAEIHEMPMRKLVAESYPGDGWMPMPRDMPE